MEWKVAWQKDDQARVLVETGWVKTETPQGNREYEAVKISHSQGLPGVVILMENQNKEIALVKQFRPILEHSVWELPRGMSEAKDASILDAAYREAREELGVQGKEAQLLGTFYPDSGLLANPVAIVKMVYDYSVTTADCEVEDITWVSLSELKKAIKSGTIQDGFTLVGVQYLALFED